MGLEDNTIDEGRRTFLRMGLVGAGCRLFRHMDAFALYEVRGQDKKDAQPEELPALKKNRITFDLAKKGDASLRMKYLDQILVDEYKMVQDKKRNPDGFVSEWFYWQDKNHNKKAKERIRADLKSDGFEKQFDDTIKGITASLPQSKIAPCYRDPLGQQKKSGYLLADQALFELTNEDELFSLLDYVCAFSKSYERNLKIGDQELNVKNGELTPQGERLINLYARSLQLATILAGKRKVSDAFKTATTQEHLMQYAIVQKRIQEHKTSYEQHQNPLDKEASEFMESLVASVNDRMKSLGYEHKLVDEKTNTYELAKIKK